MLSYPKGSGVVPIVIPLSDAAVLDFNLPDGIIVGISFSTIATTGSPTTAVATVIDGGTLSIATTLTQTAKAITEATMPSGNVSIDSAAERAINVAVTFTGGSTPHWSGTITVHFIPGAVSK